MNTSDSENYKVDHLFLLIGENPLPNYVAAKTLLADGGKPYLVFTEHTQNPAKRLKDALGLSDKEMWSLDNNESNAAEIKKKIREIVKEIQDNPDNANKKQFGLNYTGGTKAMAVHAYQALLQPRLEDPKYKLNPEPIFSYLDSHRLEMLIDQKQGNSIPIHDFRSKVQLSLKDVFDLHEPWSKKQPPIEIPKLPELAKEIATLHTDVNVARAWRWWCDYVLRPKARNPKRPSDWLEEKYLKNISIPSQSNSAESNLRDALHSILSQIKPENSFLDIKNNEFEKIREVAQLSSYLWCSANTPHITKIVTLIQQQLSLSEADLSLNDAFKKGEFTKIKHLCKWLDGEWLEHYVLQEVKNIPSCYSISDSRMSFHIPDETENDKFEFDVAFMRNYQLFALSCTTDTEIGLCKLKLFEAYRRARQMGGDEARVALVCCYEKPDKIKRGFMSQIKDDKVKVFGSGHLANLSEEIKTWIQEVDK